MGRKRGTKRKASHTLRQGSTPVNPGNSNIPSVIRQTRSQARAIANLTENEPNNQQNLAENSAGNINNNPPNPGSAGIQRESAPGGRQNQSLNMQNDGPIRNAFGQTTGRDYADRMERRRNQVNNNNQQNGRGIQQLQPPLTTVLPAPSLLGRDVRYPIFSEDRGCAAKN